MFFPSFNDMAPPMPQFGMPDMQMPDFGMPQMPAFGMPEDNTSSLFPSLDLFGSYEEEPVCNFSESDILPPHLYVRKLLQGIAKAVFKGQYHTSQDILSDECFGDWMDPFHVEFIEAFRAAKNDPFAVTPEQFKKVASKVVDMHFKLRDVCQIQKLYDDYNYWCLDHMDICSGDNFDWMSNLMNYGIPIAEEAFDLFSITFWEDDSCYTDLQSVDEVSRITESVVNMVAYVFGFDLAWDPSRVEDHYTKKEVDGAVDAYWELAYPEDENMMIDDSFLM